MNKKMALFLCLGCLLVACSHELPTATKSGREKLEAPQPFDGFIEMKKDGITHRLFIFANTNGYKNGEVVLHGSGEGLDRELMLTFELKSQGRVALNKEMTGFWDLGLCIPFRRYLLVDDFSNSINIDSYDAQTGKLSGRFSLRMRNEVSPYDTIVFSNGRFETRLPEIEFTYCIEG